MTESKRCREVQKLISVMPDCESGPTVRAVLEHISGCEACRSRHETLKKVEAVLTLSRLQVDELARESWLSRRRFLLERAALPRKRAWYLRPVPVGAAAILLVIAVAAAFFRFDRGGHVPPAARAPVTRTPAVPQAMAAASPSRTLLGVAEVLRRREVPLLKLPYTPQSPARESFTPRFPGRCALESDARLRGIVQTRIDLGAASLSPRQSFLPRSLQQTSLESDEALGRILRSKINLTRRQDI